MSGAYPSRSTGPRGSIHLFLCLLVGAFFGLLPRGLGTSVLAQNERAVDILTFHGDTGRTGWNAAEPMLTPSVLRSGVLKRVWTAPVDGDIYAQPLIVSAVSVNGTLRTLVYVVTEHDLAYAFDTADGARVWGPVSVGTPVPRATLLCGNIDPVGITSTPVIDRASSILYLAALTTPDDGRSKVYKVAALDLSSGSLRPGWPVEIAPPVSTGLHFSADVQQQRGALTLLRGVVYVPFGGYLGDCGDYHGWVVGVPVDAPRRQQAFATPTRREGGIWATGGVAVDSAGNLYAATGNSDSTGPLDFGDSVVRLQTSPSLGFSRDARDFFTPSNFISLNEADADLGSATPLVLPPQPDTSIPDLLFSAGKQGVGYLINRDNMGGVSRGDGIAGEGVYSRCIFGTCIYGNREIFSAFAYWKGSRVGQLILVPGRGSQPAPCHGTGGVVGLGLAVSGQHSPTIRPVWCSPSMRDPGAPAVSSAGAENGIVWVIDTAAGVLYALDARTGSEVYHSAGMDAQGGTHRFITPSISGGRVYVTTTHALVAYGIH